MSSILTGRRNKKRRQATPTALPAHPQRAEEDAAASGNPWQAVKGSPARGSEISDSAQPPADDGGGPQVVEWSQGPALASKAWTALLVLALFAGPVALVWTIMRPGPEPAMAGTASGDQAAAAAASERAVELTETWLRADQDDQALVESLTEASVNTLPATGLTIRDSSVQSVVPDEPGPLGTTWMVTVGVDVAEPAPGQVFSSDDGESSGTNDSEGDSSNKNDSGKDGQNSKDAADEDTAAATEPVLVWVRRYFQVPVTVQGSATEDDLLAVSAPLLPSPVAGPPAAETLGLDYPQTIPTTSEVGESVSAFLGAYVAGDGDITRYLRPGTDITAIAPPPYTAVTVKTIGGSHKISDAPADGDGTHAFVTAELTRPDGEKTTAQYVLTLVARDGRWEVSGLDRTIRTEIPVAGSGESGTE